jgi:hypothetical protein
MTSARSGTVRWHGKTCENFIYSVLLSPPFGATRANLTHASNERGGMLPGCLLPPTAAEAEAIDYLRDDFTADQLHTIRAFETPSGFRIDITAVHRFFRLTRYMGGQVSPLSLCLHEWCDTFREDHDAEFIVGGVATGFDWEGTEPSRPHDAPNKIPEHLGDSVDAKIAKMIAAGELIAVPRDAVHTVSPLLVVDKDHSGFVKYRLVRAVPSRSEHVRGRSVQSGRGGAWPRGCYLRAGGPQEARAGGRGAAAEGGPRRWVDHREPPSGRREPLPPHQGGQRRRASDDNRGAAVRSGS